VSPRARPAGPHYRVEAADPAAHLFHVTLTIRSRRPAQRVSLPAWIPGSYLVREFSRHLQKLWSRARTASRWRCTSWTRHLAGRLRAFQPAGADLRGLRLRQLGAHRLAGRQRGFFNGTSLCLRVHGQAQEPHELELVPLRAYPHWEAATGLEPLKTGKRGFGTYLAQDYDELVDCPVELGPFFSAEFRAGGVPHRLVVAGATEVVRRRPAGGRHAEDLRDRRSASGTTASGRRSRATCSC
jgi:predicted metalloprotease with PDZ domain